MLKFVHSALMMSLNRRQVAFTIPENERLKEKAPRLKKIKLKEANATLCEERAYNRRWFKLRATRMKRIYGKIVLQSMYSNIPLPIISNIAISTEDAKQE